jgi:hypothetical protein
MPHFTRSWKLANTKQPKIKKKKKPLSVPDMKPIKHATPKEIFGSDLKISNKKKSK